jgi:hypothetical protein
VGRQDEEEKDVVGAMEDTEMQAQQEHEVESELEGENEEFDDLAIEGCLHNGEEEDGSDNSKDEDCDCDSIDKEDEDIRPAKRRRLLSPLRNEGLEDCGKHRMMPDMKRIRRALPTATSGAYMKSKAMRTRARTSQSMSNSILHTLPGARLLQRSLNRLLNTRSGPCTASSKH